MSTSVRQARRPAAAPPRRTAPRRAVLPGWVIPVAGALAAVVIATVLLLARGQSGTDAQAAPGVPTPPPTAVVAEINGRQIPVREFAIYLAQERAATFGHFQKVYGATDGPHFWTTPHGGTTPADYLKKRALADVARTTVVLDLAHQQRLIADPGYGAFLAAWTAENARRRQAVAAHQVIYGPVQYTESNYLTYVLHDLASELKQKLAAKGVLKVTDDALRHYYDTHKGALRQGELAGGPYTTPPFSQVRAQVRQMYLDDRYADLVARSARSARVHVDHAVLDALSVN